MSELTPEQLKVIAIGMGYEIFSEQSEGKSITIWDGANIHTRKRYKPHTINNDQMVEIEDHIIKHSAFNTVRIFWIEEINRWSFIYMAEYSADEIVGVGATRAEAVCNAAFKYFSK